MTIGKNNYYNWFRTIVNACIALFFLFSFVSNLFAYASVFEGILKYVVVAVLFVAVALTVFIFKERIRKIINVMTEKLSLLSFRQMFFILMAIAIVLKAFYYAFFFFDSTAFGQDITIYAQIADKIAEGGIRSVKNQIYYLVGMGVHLSIFKKISIPYHLAIFFVFLLATMIDFYSFSKHIGKEKSFILILLYLLMPSTSMLTFCITHELYVYLYFSLIFLFLNMFLERDDMKGLIIDAVLLIVFISLNQTVSPMGKIWFILLVLLVLLSNLDLKKRGLLALVLVISFLCSDVLTTRLETNFISQGNNYEQLLIGSDLESMGRHTDGKGRKAARKYWESRGVSLTLDNIMEGQRLALIEQYKYLITHPDKLLKLLSYKFFVAWSGDFYSLEYAHNMGSINDIVYSVMLVIGSLIWLFTVTAAIVYHKKDERPISVYNYEIILLGVAAVLLITEIMNKYSCYMTLFIYFIAFARISSSKEREI